MKLTVKFLMLFGLAFLTTGVFGQGMNPTGLRRSSLLRGGSNAAGMPNRGAHGGFSRTGMGGLRRGNPGGTMPGMPGAAGANAGAGADGEKTIEEQLAEIPKGTNGVPTRLAFDQAPLDILVYSYADVAKLIPIFAPNLPKTQVTLKSLEDEELTKEKYLEAITRVLTVNGVVLYEVDNTFLYVLDRKTARAQGIRTSMNPTNALPEKGVVMSQLMRFTHITAEEAQKAIEGFKSPEGLFQVFERNNSILVTDTQENVNRMLEIIRELDVANPVLEDVFTRQIKFALAADIKTALETIVTESQKAANPGQSGPKTSGAPGFSSARPTTPQPSRLLNLNNRPGLNQPQPVTPNATMTAQISDADRGMIRGKVLILSDERSNKLIVITEKTNMDFFDKIIETLDVETTPEVSVEVVRLKYADSEEVASMLNDLIGNGSSSSSKTNPNGAARTGAGANRNLTARPGMTPAVRTPTAQPTFANAASSSLGELNKDNIKILADKRINGIVIMARKTDMKAVKEVIEDMDVKLSQVLIEVVIVQVELGDDLQTGIDWVQRGRQKQYTTVQATDKYGRALYWQEEEDDNGNTTMSQTAEVTDYPVLQTVKKVVRDGFYNNGSYQLGGGGGSASSKLGSLVGQAAEAVATNTVAASPIGTGLNYLLKSDKLNLAAIVQMTKGDSKTKVLASPILMTVDNKEATIEATDMIYLFSGYQYSGSTYSGSQVRNYEKRDIGLTVKVTPKINPNGTVMLTVEQTFETKGADQQVPNENGGTDPYATVTTRKISSDVSVENRQTVVMGGLSKKTISNSETGIPLLKDIPIIGKWLFSSVSQSEARSELLVFMTPYVLDDADAAQAEAIRRKKSLSDPRPWEDNGWSLSPVADPISKKEQLRRLEEEWKRQDEERKTEKAIEKAKEKRVRDLKKMNDDDRQEWVKEHEKELVEDNKITAASQKDLRELVDEIRAKHNMDTDEALPPSGGEKQPAKPVDPPKPNAKPAAKPVVEEKKAVKPVDPPKPAVEEKKAVPPQTSITDLADKKDTAEQPKKKVEQPVTPPKS